MNETIFDLIIVGGGIAGLSAAQYASRATLKTVVFEGNLPGGQSLNIAQLENYPGLFPAIQGYEFIDTAKKQAQTFGAEFITQAILSIDKVDQLFTVKTAQKNYTARTIILATGCEHRPLQIGGEKELAHRGVSYCATCDGPFFKGKHVVVVGGGDSACDEAQFLAKIAQKVTLIHRRDEFRAQAAVAKRVMENPKIDVKLSTVPLAILGENSVNAITLRDLKTNTESTITADAVFIFVGMLPQTKLIDLAKKDDEGFILTDENMETSISGIFCAGDVRSKPFRQIVTAASDGAVAAHSVAHYLQNLQ